MRIFIVITLLITFFLGFHSGGLVYSTGVGTEKVLAARVVAKIKTGVLRPVKPSPKIGLEGRLQKSLQRHLQKHMGVEPDLKKYYDRGLLEFLEIVLREYKISGEIDFEEFDKELRLSYEHEFGKPYKNLSDI